MEKGPDGKMPPVRPPGLVEGHPSSRKSRKGPRGRTVPGCLGNSREARGATAKRVSGRGQRRSLGRWASRNPDKGVGAQTHPCRARGVNKSGSVHTVARYRGITVVFTKDT